MKRYARLMCGIVAWSAVSTGNAGGPGWDGGGPYPIYGRSAELQGTRSVQAQTLAAQGSDWGSAMLEWSIHSPGPAQWRYQYTFRNFNPRSIGYVTVDLPRDAFFGISTNFGWDASAIQNVVINGKNATQLTYSLAGLDGMETCVRIDETVDANQLIVYEFDSNRAPEWGHMFVRGGGPPNDPVYSNNASNVGLGDESGLDAIHYVARPGRLIRPGNMNCDSLINTQDLFGFITALTNSEGYESIYPACNLQNADVNMDGLVNGRDIQVFVDILVAP